MAAVAPEDSKLVEHYHALYRQLRGLHVTRWDYTFGNAPTFDMAAARRVPVGVQYCFASCPAAAAPPDAGLPLLLDFERRGPEGQYLIAGISTPQDSEPARPLPWEHA
ncbi:hypothetical protein ABZ671_28250 [Micromonospora sp. NPDC006766]|uniref:hypothetical protein n=1 Tax=Micromonospora sp. NPDC006766 TaxID=3154778 RepID=UPI0033CC0906